jgi:hypothetical protein
MRCQQPSTRSTSDLGEDHHQQGGAWDPRTKGYFGSTKSHVHQCAKVSGPGDFQDSPRWTVGLSEACVFWALPPQLELWDKRLP